MLGPDSHYYLMIDVLLLMYICRTGDPAVYLPILPHAPKEKNPT